MVVSLNNNIYKSVSKQEGETAITIIYNVANIFQTSPFTQLTWGATITGMKVLRCLCIFPTIGSCPSQLFARSPTGTIMKYSHSFGTMAYGNFLQH